MAVWRAHARAAAASPQVMISPEADPPVCRLIDYSKFKYDQVRGCDARAPGTRRLTQRLCMQTIKAKEAQKKMAAGRQEVKELKMRCVTTQRLLQLLAHAR